MAHTIIIFSFTTVMSVSLVAALKCYAGLICLGATITDIVLLLLRSE
jgi:hypothetical protein